MRNFLYEYFYYTRSERNGAIVLCFLIFFFLFLPDLAEPFLLKNKKPRDFSETMAEISQFFAESHLWQEPEEGQEVFRQEDIQFGMATEYFYFDPNTASLEDFVRLGLRPKVAQAILNYRNKGGQFRKKEDFSKIYTLRKEDYQRLEPWIRIATYSVHGSPKQQNDGAQSIIHPSPSKYNSVQHRKMPAEIEINLASLEEWQQLRGIGITYARRIVSFREKLGGFYSVEQIAETYGFPDSVFQQIKPFLKHSHPHKKISIQEATVEELKAHPYINSTQANCLQKIRQQYGTIPDLKTLKSAACFNDDNWLRLEPYLSLD